MNVPSDETSHVVQKPETHDTPTHRATIAQLTVDELDAWLDRIRERRLAAVRKLEAAAKVRADSIQLAAFLKLEVQIKSAKRSMAKLDEMIEKTEKAVHRCRLAVMAAQMEVGDEEAAA